MINQAAIVFGTVMVLSATIAQTPPVGGQPTCTVAQAMAILPTTRKAMNEWQEKSRVVVPDTVAEELQLALCVAAKELAAEWRAEPSSFDGAAGAAISEHLDRMTDRTKQGRTLSAALRAQLGTAGVSRPTPKEYGVVVVDYRKTVDTLTVGRQTVRPFPRLLVELGAIDIVGIAEGRVVCSGRVTVVPERDVPFVC